MKKALIKCAPGSGLHETYWGTLKLSLEANKSMSNGPHRSCMALKTSWDKDHSVESRRALDSLSASIFSDPGIWVALSQMSRCIHHSHITVAMSLHGIDLIPPMALMYDTVVVLSD